MSDRFAKNLKNGRTYVILHNDATDCTNVRDGLPVVVYATVPQEGTCQKVFVRDKQEFQQKFEPVCPLVTPAEPKEITSAGASTVPGGLCQDTGFLTDMVTSLVKKKRLVLEVNVSTVDDANQILQWMYSKEKPMASELVKLSWDSTTVSNQEAETLRILKERLIH